MHQGGSSSYIRVQFLCSICRNYMNYYPRYMRRYTPSFPIQIREAFLGCATAIRMKKYRIRNIRQTQGVGLSLDQYKHHAMWRTSYEYESTSPVLRNRSFSGWPPKGEIAVETPDVRYRRKCPGVSCRKRMSPASHRSIDLRLTLGHLSRPDSPSKFGG